MYLFSVCACVVMILYSWQFTGSVLVFHHVDPRDWTLVLRFGSLAELSHLLFFWFLTHGVIFPVQSGLKFAIFLPYLSQVWNFRYELPHLVLLYDNAYVYYLLSLAVLLINEANYDTLDFCETWMRLIEILINSYLTHSICVQCKYSLSTQLDLECPRSCASGTTIEGISRKVYLR